MRWDSFGRGFSLLMEDLWTETSGWEGVTHMKTEGDKSRKKIQPPYLETSRQDGISILEEQKGECGWSVVNKKDNGMGGCCRRQ